MILELSLLSYIFSRDNWMRNPVLSEIQSKILLALLQHTKASSGDMLKAVGISGSTWNKEKMLLSNVGLIEGQITRGLGESGVVRKMEFKLTTKGMRVAQNLLLISSLIGDEAPQLEKVGAQPELSIKV